MSNTDVVLGADDITNDTKGKEQRRRNKEAEQETKGTERGRGRDNDRLGRAECVEQLNGSMRSLRAEHVGFGIFSVYIPVLCYTCCICVCLCVCSMLCILIVQRDGAAGKNHPVQLLLLKQQPELDEYDNTKSTFNQSEKVKKRQPLYLLLCMMRCSNAE